MHPLFLRTTLPGTSRRNSRLQRDGRQRRHRLTMESLECRNLLATGYLEMNLVSNQAGAALLQDPALNLPWGIALPSDSGNFWVDNAGSGVVTLYGGDVAGSALTKDPLTVQIPGGAPTADVFNNSGSSSDFVINGPGGASGAATYLFASLDGRISGWNAAVSQNHAIQVAHVHGAFFTGLAMGDSSSGNVLYAADFQNGKIDVFDGNFQQTSLSGDFTDPNLPSGYAPFNVQNIDGKLYVTYAVQQSSSHHSSDQHDGGGERGVFTPAATGGIVDVFDLNGNFVKRFATNGDLNAPWGLAMAPSGFGDFPATCWSATSATARSPPTIPTARSMSTEPRPSINCQRSGRPDRHQPPARSELRQRRFRRRCQHLVLHRRRRVVVQLGRNDQLDRQRHRVVGPIRSGCTA